MLKNELKQNHRRIWKTNSRDSLKQECLVPHRKVISYVVAPRNTFCVQSRWYYKVQFVQNSVWALLLPCGGRGRCDLLLAAFVVKNRLLLFLSLYLEALLATKSC